MIILGLLLIINAIIQWICIIRIIRDIYQLEICIIGINRDVEKIKKEQESKLDPLANITIDDY